MDVDIKRLKIKEIDNGKCPPELGNQFLIISFSVAIS
jgi:hypothetical protein